MTAIDHAHQAVCKDFSGYARFPIGTKVCLKSTVSEDRNIAKVRGYQDIMNGGLVLDNYLGGTRQWSVLDVIEI